MEDFEQDLSARNTNYNKNDNEKNVDVTQRNRNDTSESTESGTTRKIRKEIHVMEQLKNVGYSTIKLADQVDENDYGRVGQRTDERFQKYGTGMLDLVGSGAAFRYMKEKSAIESKIINIYEKELSAGNISLDDILKSNDLYKMAKEQRKHINSSIDYSKVFGNDYINWKKSEPSAKELEHYGMGSKEDNPYAISPDVFYEDNPYGIGPTIDYEEEPLPSHENAFELEDKKINDAYMDNEKNSIYDIEIFQEYHNNDYIPHSLEKGIDETININPDDIIDNVVKESSKMASPKDIMKMKMEFAKEYERNIIDLDFIGYDNSAHRKWANSNPGKNFKNGLKGKGLKDAEYIRDSIMARQALKEFAQSDLGKKALDKRTIDFIENGDFYNISKRNVRKLRTQSVSTYMKYNPDPLLRSMPLTKMSDRKYKELLKKSEKFNLGAREQSILRMYEKDRRIRKTRQVSKNKKFKARRYFLYEAKNKLLDKASMEYSGIHTIQSVYTSGRAALSCIKVVALTSSFLGRNIIVRPIKAISRKIGLTRKLNSLKLVKKYKHAKSNVKQAKVVVKKAVKLPSYMARRTCNNVVTGVSKTAFGKIVKKGGKVVGKPIKAVGKTVKFITKPFRFIHRVRIKLQTVLTKIKIAIGIIIASLLIIYVALMIGANYLLSTLNAFKEEASNTIYFDDDTQLEQLRQVVTDMDDTRLQELIDYALAEHVISVSGGHTTDHYGSPDGGDFYTIKYLDSEGYDLGNKISNIKDLLCITCVVFQYDLTDTVAVEQFMKDLYYTLVPVPVYVESDIYYCTSGCYTYNYHCNSGSDYSDMASWWADGVHRYGSIHSQTSEGCVVSHYSCNGHEHHRPDGSTYHTNHGSHMSSACSDCDTHYKCNGHSVVLCYGHRNLEIQNTLYFKEDLYSGIISLPNNPLYQDKVDMFYNDGGFDYYASWIDNLYNQDWFELYGFDVNGGVGFDTADVLLDEEQQEIIDNLDASQARLDIVSYALSMVGRVPYYWGGDASCQGWDGNNFGVEVTPDYRGRHQKGLDCAGFVGWVIWTVTDLDVHTCSTRNLASSLGSHRIGVNQLKPGDLAFQNVPGSAENHVGIYAGKDASGNMMWIHCNGAASNVSYNHVSYWRYYYSWLD